jgi:alcohol dehydrogenase class IV
MDMVKKDGGTVYSIQKLRMPSILFGSDTIKEIGKEIQKLHGKKVMVITDKYIVKLGLLNKAIQAMEKEGLEIALFEDVEFEPTIEMVEKALKAIRKNSYDIIIGFGGGSVLDAAKVLACLVTNEGQVRDYVGSNKISKRGLPFILVPTTGGTGSEVSPNGVFIDETDGNKKIISDDKLFPALAIVDPLLTLSVPPKLTAYTGMDALCHAMGCYISKKANPLTDAIAIEAIDRISHNLRQAVFKGQGDVESRYNMSLGATMGMIARVNSGGGAVHGLSYPLGTKYHLPHSQSIALLMPHVMEFNLTSAVPKFARVAKAMGEKVKDLGEEKAAERAPESVKNLARDIGILQGLREFGVKKEDFPEFAEIVYRFSYRHIEVNPRMLSKQDIIKIYENAW